MSAIVGIEESFFISHEQSLCSRKTQGIFWAQCVDSFGTQISVECWLSKTLELLVTFWILNSASNRLKVIIEAQIIISSTYKLYLCSYMHFYFSYMFDPHKWNSWKNTFKMSFWIHKNSTDIYEIKETTLAGGWNRDWIRWHLSIVLWS